MMVRLRQRLGLAPSRVVAIFAALVTFLVYSSMFGFRKAFAAGSFDEVAWLGISTKVWLVCAQVLGYMASKFYGIGYIAANNRRGRGMSIALLILIAWIGLLGFALVPSPWNILFFFINGFPLGMVWGLVFSFVEGRRTTEWIGAVLSSSFIFASGFAKSVGKWLVVDVGITERWMPLAAGAVFVLPLLAGCLLLEAIPPPNAADEQHRSPRLPMDRQAQRNLMRQFFPGLSAIILAYVILTILRDFRDNFANELLTEAGLAGQASIFTQTEIPVALLLLLVMGMLVWIKDNAKAFLVNHLIIAAGFTMAGVATLLYMVQLIPAFYWFLLVGIGLYMGYIPLNCLYFERMIASFRIAGNVGFLIYLADAVGYLGSVSVTFFRGFGGDRLAWIHFFTTGTLIGSVAGLLLVIAALYYFNRQYKRAKLRLQQFPQ